MDDRERAVRRMEHELSVEQKREAETYPIFVACVLLIGATLVFSLGYMLIDLALMMRTAVKL